MNEEQSSIILRFLSDSNEWWMKEKVNPDKTGTFKRRDFYTLKRELNDQLMTAIVGPRQVGKTTLLHQLIQELLDQKIATNHILYVQLDRLLIQPELRDARIDDILDVFSNRIVKKQFRDLDKPVYIFLDEIQKVKDWNDQLKGLIDLKHKIKFIISGSSSNNILKGSAEALTGRMSINIVLPLKFADVATIREPKLKDKILENGLSLRKRFSESFGSGNYTKLHQHMQEAATDLVASEKTLQVLLDQYLVVGGYPLTLRHEGFAKLAKELYDYAFLAVHRDIIGLFAIRNANQISDLLVLVASESPNVASYESIGSELKMEGDTVKRYLGYLEDAFLLSQSSLFTRNIRKKQKSLRKIYLLDTGIRNALLGKLTESLLTQPEELGSLAEMVLHNHLRRLKFNLEQSPRTKIDYWKNGHEIDTVFVHQNKPIPIECKYKNEPTAKDLRGLYEFIEAHKSPFGILITKNTLKREKNILFIPLRLFLLMC